LYRVGDIGQQYGGRYFPCNFTTIQGVKEKNYYSTLGFMEVRLWFTKKRNKIETHMNPSQLYQAEIPS
jgi:hypothetical protein